MSRLRLDLSYDGTEFHGWAQQPGLRTVQGELESSLAEIFETPVRVTCAGRTDAGVHASGQVSHFDAPRLIECEAVLGRLRRSLPSDIVVSHVRAAPPGFDARFSALSRSYVYRLCDASSGTPALLRRFVVGVPYALDADAMHSAAQQLLGLHDFAAFCKRREGATTVRTLQKFQVQRKELAGASIVEVCIEADAFCHSMVRSLVGALLVVGRHRQPPAWPAELLEARVRSGQATVAPPHGLELTRVDYPPEAGMAERAEQTRAVRGAL